MLSACAAEAPPLPASPGLARQPPSPTSLASVTESALTDAARLTGLARADLKVVDAQPVTWSDGSLGCPEEGMLYSQSLVPGYRVRVAASGHVLDYHAGRDGRLLLCPDSRAVPPVSDTDT
jgi:hypothetical protein